MCYHRIMMKPSWAKDLAFIAAFSLGSTLLLWLPFLLHLDSFWGITLPSGGFSVILRNFDGLNYIVVAKSLYDPNSIAGFPQLSLPAIYFASHFPLYPLFINAVAPVFGHLYGMLAVTVVFTVFAAWAFYTILVRLNLSLQPLWLALLFLILPARFLIVRSVGAPETLFIFLLFVALYFFIRGTQTNHDADFWIAGLAGAAAQLTRSPGILFFLAMVFYVTWEYVVHKRLLWKAYPLLLIPLSLAGLFFYFDKTYGDFLAYFHSGNNIHLTFPPFAVFNSGQFWVGSMWLEDVVWVYLIYTVAALVLFTKRLYPMAFFVTTFLAASVFVAHRDIARYTLPIAPFALIAFDQLVSRREFKIAMLIIAVAIYLFALNFTKDNTFPFYDLTAYR